MHSRIEAVIAIGLLACSPHAPTYYDDVAPIVAKRCGDCHAAGPRAFTAANIAQAMPAMLAAIDDGRMPPWLPEGGDWLNSPVPTAGELDTLRAWNANPVMGLPKTSPQPARPTADAIVSRTYRNTTGEHVRCFVLDPPPGNVTAYGWALDAEARAAAHHMSADLIAAADSPAVRDLDRGDGWDCTALALSVPVKASFSSSSTAAGPGFTYPEGYGMAVAPGDALVVNVHLTGPTGSLEYGVSLWYGRQPVRPTNLWAMLAPSQLECPPSAAGSRLCQFSEAAKEIVPGVMPTRAENLATCGGPEILGVEADGRFPIHSSCQQSLFPGPQRVINVTAHAHYKATAIRAWAQRTDGTWFDLLRIPRWRPKWEGVYAPAERLVIAGMVRMECDFDNGLAAQQSAVVPFSDPPVPPLLAPEMSVWGDARRWPGEMCQVRLELAGVE